MVDPKPTGLVLPWTWKPETWTAVRRLKRWNSWNAWNVLEYRLIRQDRKYATRKIWHQTLHYKNLIPTPVKSPDVSRLMQKRTPAILAARAEGWSASGWRRLVRTNDPTRFDWKQGRQSGITNSARVEKGNKKKFSHERLCLLTWPLMGDRGIDSGHHYLATISFRFIDS